MEKWQDSETIVFWIYIVFIIVLFLGVTIVLFVQIHLKRMTIAREKLVTEKIKHQEGLIRSSVIAQERERERIASDLHDELIGKLNILALASASKTVNIDMQKTLRETIGVARRISHDLSPPLLDETCLAEWIRDMVNPLNDFYSLTITIREDPSLELPKDVKLQLIRIVQEVINNCMKHAKATRLAFTLRESTSYVALKITDDGVGFRTMEKFDGLGLRNIELRIQLLKGQYRLRSSEGKGTSLLLLIKLPINE